MPGSPFSSVTFHRTFGSFHLNWPQMVGFMAVLSMAVGEQLPGAKDHAKAAAEPFFRAVEWFDRTAERFYRTVRRFCREVDQLGHAAE
jgi:hypothetical protein